MSLPPRSRAAAEIMLINFDDEGGMNPDCSSNCTLFQQQ